MDTTAITGIGIVTPSGLDTRQWFAGLCRGRRLLRPFAGYADASGSNRSAFAANDVDPAKVLPSKGLQYFGRTHLLAAAAARLAMTDCGMTAETIDPAHMGVVMAMTFGTLQNIARFYEQALADGPAAVSPLSFANTVANSPASRTAIILGAKGLNATLAHGENAGLDAVAYSADQLDQGPERLILAGSGYGLCPDMMRAYDARGLLAPEAGDKGQPAFFPLDNRTGGLVLGEAAAVLALETVQNALSRNARVYGYAIGHAQGFNPDWPPNGNQAVATVAATMQRALDKAGLSPAQIDWVAAGACGHPGLDSVEARAITTVFANTAKIRVSALKSMTGECFDTAGPLAVAAALLSMEQGAIPPTAGVLHPHGDLPSGCLSSKAVSGPVRHVLVNALSLGGGCSSLVVSANRRAC